MKIISKMSDYYDGVGYSDSPIFIRSTRILDNKDEDSADWKLEGLESLFAPAVPCFESGISMDFRANDVLTVIAFCGERHILYDISGRFYNSVHSFFEAVDRGRSADGMVFVSAVAKENLIKKHKKFVSNQRESDKRVRGFARNQGWSINGRFHFSELGWKQWSDSVKGKTAVPSETHRYWKTPVLAQCNGKYIVNPNLKKLGFQTVADPYTAYQEIEMYLGNQMVDQFDPSVGRTDNEIRDSHGMDHWSFKTKSPGRKSRKQKRK